MFSKVGRFLKGIPVQHWYGIVAVLVVLWYIDAREVLISQDAWVRVVKSKMTFNFILMAYLIGHLADRGKLGKTKRMNWIMWLVGLMALITFQMFSTLGE